MAGMISRQRPWSAIVLYAVALHLIWARALLVDPSAGGVTAIAFIVYWLSVPGAAVLMLICALLALISHFVIQRQWAAGFMVPQQFLLFISAGGCIAAMISGHFADGVPRPRAFLIADQMPAVLAAILHTFAIYRVGRPWNGTP